ncbi:hypothetical protein GJ688_05515 [Heliobacillus mobilis]|uniref:G5 domain-containing protein n=1 Tax=Heliobacterium mobile TaxID=28064 RepID=A0A6I3SHW0_HELMO|nr:3D domain-containing protein [Heliobacterium mobile]MTV48441.1 hypothetical protein [Heliobacterium mobile]
MDRSSTVVTESKGKARLKSPWIVGTAAFFALVGMLSTVMMSDAFRWKTLSIDSEGQTRIVRSRAKTVKDVLTSEGIPYEIGDRLTPMEEEPVTDGMVIHMEKSRWHELALDGRKMNFKLTGSLSKEKLQEMGISFGKEDRLEAVAEDGVSRWRIVRVEKQSRNRTEPIPFERQELTDGTMPKGQSRVVVQGEEGLKEITEVVTLENGVEVGAERLKEEVQKPARNEVVIRGEGSDRGGSRLAMASRGRSTRLGQSGGIDDGLPQGSKIAASFTVSATAYTHTGSRTATGRWPSVGVVAVDPRVIPLGTKLFVENYGMATAADTGGAIKGNKIDVFFDTEAECIRWGRQPVTVHIVEE